MNIVLSFITVLLLLGIGVLLSESRKDIKWRTVITGILVQVVVIGFVIKTTIGQTILDYMARAVTKILSFGNDGLAFVFGGFSTDFYSFFINVLCLIAFVSALISVLYYLKVIPFLVKHIGGFIAKMMGTTPAETFSAVGNCFLSGTESPLLIQPYLDRLTRSELFSVCLGGYASASASVIAGYCLLGIPMKYLLVAMVTVPFSTLVMAKILIPETQESKLKEITIEKSECNNIFEAIGNGGIQGFNVALSVSGVLIAFLGIVAILDYGLGFVGTDTSNLLGIIFRPLAWLLNIPTEEVAIFSNMIGIKTATNEYVAFTQLSPMIQGLSTRTLAILGVILCNFANFSVIGIQTGAFKSFCPKRANEVAGFGIKALIGGILTTLITGAIVGMFF